MFFYLITFQNLLKLYFSSNFFLIKKPRIAQKFIRKYIVILFKLGDELQKKIH